MLKCLKWRNTGTKINNQQHVHAKMLKHMLWMQMFLNFCVFFVSSYHWYVYIWVFAHLMFLCCKPLTQSPTAIYKHPTIILKSSFCHSQAYMKLIHDTSVNMPQFSTRKHIIMPFLINTLTLDTGGFAFFHPSYLNRIPDTSNFNVLGNSGLNCTFYARKFYCS